MSPWRNTMFIIGVLLFTMMAYNYEQSGRFFMAGFGIFVALVCVAFLIFIQFRFRKIYNSKKANIEQS